jgi:hypothetical protein
MGNNIDKSSNTQKPISRIFTELKNQEKADNRRKMTSKGLSPNVEKNYQTNIQRGIPCDLCEKNEN